jgi:hypothetical protein
MARNTNIESLFFPVREQEVSLTSQSFPIKGYKAIIGIFPNDQENVLAIVSSRYKLITNRQAYDIGKEIHQGVFEDAKAENFEVFNIMASETKSFCHIDIIDKNYKLNIWKKEVYVPFIRIHNSYNGRRSLQLDIGFCRKLCDNGAIFEKNTVNLRFVHTRNAIHLNALRKIDVEHLKSLERDFVVKTQKSATENLPRKYFVPLAAKALSQRFDLDRNDLKKFQRELKRKKQFSTAINSHTDYSIM